MGVLLFLLDRKVGGFDKKRLIIPFTKIAWSTAFMGIMLYIPMRFLDEFVFDTTRTINLIALTITAGVIGMSAYLLITSLLKVEEVELFYKLLKKVRVSKTNLTTESINLVETETESL